MWVGQSCTSVQHMQSVGVSTTAVSLSAEHSRNIRKIIQSLNKHISMYAWSRQVPSH